MTGAHISTLVLALSAFAALALATERHAKHLLRFLPAPRWRLAARVLGWVLLGLALVCAMRGLATPGIGIALALGWMAIAALAMVFGLPKWPWQPPVKATPARAPRAKGGAGPEEALRVPRRWIGWGLLGVTAAVFSVALLRVETKPLHRADAIRGQIGPWAFRFAEADRDTPEIADMQVPLKAYRLRFCETCDTEIMQAYLKVNRPRALRAAGMAFDGSRWDRSVEIQLPANLTASSELWLTVVGKDGSVHQTRWPMRTVSPTTVDWFEQQRSAR